MNDKIQAGYNVTTKALIHGKIVNFDQSRSRYTQKKYPPPNSEYWKFLGKGTVYSVNGVKQESTQIYNFYRRIPEW